MTTANLAPEEWTRISRVLNDDSMQLSDLLGPGQSLDRPQFCPLNGSRITEGYMVQGLGICSESGALLALIRRLAGAVNVQEEPPVLPFKVFTELTREDHPTYLLASHVLAFCGDDIYVVKNRGGVPEYSSGTPRRPDRILAVLPDGSSKKLELRRESEPPQSVVTSVDMGAIELRVLASRDEATFTGLTVGEGVAPLTVDEVRSLPEVSESYTSSGQGPHFASEKKNKVVIVRKGGPKIDIRSLPPGTVVHYETEPRPEIDRTPIGPGFDMSQITALDLNLIRRHDDPLVGPAIMQPFSGEVRIEKRAFDLSTLPDEHREVFEGYRAETIILRNAGDVARYERTNGDPGLMAALEAEDRTDFGDAFVDEEHDGTNLRRDGVSAKLSIPARCAGAPAPRKN